MEAAIQYAKERETFGTKIGNSQRLVIARHLLGLA
jgi:alkylation response protein AidB-like acyl-CoA dehydrogenase